jgi:hypothetical protein
MIMNAELKVEHSDPETTSNTLDSDDSILELNEKLLVATSGR